MRFVRTAENLFGLPLGFTRVEYLQSTGTQYIDTGFKMSNDNMTFDGNIMWTNKNATANFFFGYRLVDSPVVTGDMRAFFVYGASASPIGRLAIRYGVNADNSTQAISLNTKYNISWNGSNLKINGTTYDTLSQAYTPASYKSMFLFWCNCENTYSADVGKFVGRVYNWQIKQDGVLVRDFIPCIDPLGVPCMYDLVGKKPYYNAGTGTFTVGRQVIPVEYLESSGTQYINTGYAANANTIVEYNFNLVEVPTSSAFFGSGTSSTSTDRFQGYYESSLSFSTKLASTTTYSNVILTAGTKHYSKMGIPLAGYYIDDTFIASATGTPTSLNLYVFARNINGSMQVPIKMKLYDFKISENNSLVRDFIPCKDENNVGFMFDKVSGTCYLNAGTGSFIVGENKYTSKLRLIKDAIRIPDGYKRVEYLESSGTQYIDTGYIPTNTTGVQVRHTICADNSKDNIVFGCREGSGESRFWEDIDWTNSDTIGWGFNSYSSTTAGTRFPISGMDGQTIVSSMNFMNDRAGRVNGVLYDTSLKTKTLVTITRSICLFAANYAGTMSFFTACKIFSCQISEGSTLVRSFIPVRDENNVGYMFDEVTGQMFGNAGSGSFGIGNDLPTAKVRFIQDVIPSDYIPLKYLESTGTQWIDTGVYPTQLTEAEYRCAVTGSVANVDSHLFGSRLSANSEAFDLAYMNMTPSNGLEKFRFIHGTTTTQETTTSMTPSQIANTHTYYMSGTSFKVDGSERLSFTTASFTGSYSLWLFGVNNAGSLHNQVRAQRVYKCIIWDNCVPVRDLYPALRKSDNKPGMYDRITRQFFVNQGTGEFNYEI